jgi:aryl-alcohol dehydrogenase-like predicted oxidoreductase
MDYIQLDRNDTRISRVVLGTMTFGAQTEEKVAFRMMDYCRERGVNFFDTANVYNGGRSEEIVGRWMRGRRDKIVLASKVGIKAGEGADEQGLSRGAIRRGIEGSLRRLGTNYLDFYYLHTPDYDTPMEETLSEMSELVQEGKIRYLAASNYASWQMCRLLWLAERHGMPAVRMVQPMYNVISRGIEQELLPMCRAFGLPTVVYNPLAGGLLTGKHGFRDTVPGSRFDGNEQYRERYWYEANFDAVETLRKTARAAGMSLVQLAIRWLVHHGQADALILGASRFEHLAANLGACEQEPLPEQTVEVCNMVWRRLRGVSPVYNR